MSQSLLPGLEGVLFHRVEERDLASSWKNEFPVLATPILLWLAELACMKAIEGALPEGEITLGLAHNSSHVGASLLGSEIEIRAVLSEAGPRTLEFIVEAFDGGRTVFKGTHTRAHIGRERFLEKLNSLKASAV